MVFEFRFVTAVTGKLRVKSLARPNLEKAPRGKQGSNLGLTTRPLRGPQKKEEEDEGEGREGGG